MMMSSRIVVKNLPTAFTEQKLRRLFDESNSKCGWTVTDVHLKYTRQGKFRQFAFVGFKNASEATAAVERFHSTFIGTSKIKVEMCVNLGDAANKPRAWSKHTVGKAGRDAISTAIVTTPIKGSVNVEGKRDKDVERNKYDDDPLFAEFMEVNKPRVNKTVWGNDAIDAGGFDYSEADLESDEDSDVNDDDDEDHSKIFNRQKAAPSDVGEEINVAVSDVKISDLDYLKSKVVVDTSNEEETIKGSKHQSKFSVFTVTLRGIPLGSTKSAIKTFLKPAKATRICRPRKTRGIFHVGLATSDDLKLALNKHRSFLDGHRVCVTVCKAASGEQAADVNGKEDEKFLKHKALSTELEKSAESIAESGMLFVRNLPFTVSEEDLEALFKPYGPLAEVRLPVDRFTRKVMGFAVVVYVIPEHAVKAYCELDATTFQGRNLHLLPGKSKNVDKEKGENGEPSFKKQSDAKKKSQSGSSHNWNALFLGANAVADVVAGRYDTTKQELLDAESPESIAVRLALGETQIVIETRKFLLENGIELDSFSQPACERSKVVILAKNLPAGTSVDEVRNLFTKYGLVGRVILPPSGITAVIEFYDPNEARTAFRSLAYTKFKSAPLYLEWAPVKIFNKPSSSDKTGNEQVSALPVVEKDKSESKDLTEKNKAGSNIAVKDSSDSSTEEDDEKESAEPEPETTIFVKNLSQGTTDEILKKFFESCGQLHSVEISKKKDLDNPGKSVSMGYGFVRYKHRVSCQKAMRFLQNSPLDGNNIKLKLSDRATRDDDQPAKIQKRKSTKQKSTKILVRNVAFEATKKEFAKLFRTFGELKAVRLPKKVAGTGSHRGFGFVDYLTRAGAKRAFEALCHSTHFYGRRLVLEWAETDDSVENLRRKTAEHYHDGETVHKRARKAAITEDVERIVAAEED